MNITADTVDYDRSGDHDQGVDDYDYDYDCDQSVDDDDNI